MEFTKDLLCVKSFSTRKEMGIAAARDVSKAVRELLKKRDVINMIFAAAPSQLDFFEAFVKEPDVDWKRIRAFHMDEYIGLESDAPQGFGNFLKEHIFSKVPFLSIQYIDGQNPDIEAECGRYSCLLSQYPVDIVCLGIGENGHIAFNDPHVAKFDDPAKVKVVALDKKCRMQQVHDGCFASLESVPTKALTLTITALTEAEQMFCIVPAKTKAEAVKATIDGPISESCPASILRSKTGTILYLDSDSASLLEFE